MCRIHFRHAPVAPVLRTVLLERLYTVKGLAAAREFYDGAAYSPPFGRGFHLKMLELEKSEGKIDAKRARRVYEAATDQFKVGEVWFFYKSIRSSSVMSLVLIFNHRMTLTYGSTSRRSRGTMGGRATWRL